MQCLEEADRSAQQKKRSPPRADERVLGFLNSLLTLADLQARGSQIDDLLPALAIPALTVMPVTRAYNLAHTCAGSATHLQSNPIGDVAALRTCLGFLHLPSGSARTARSPSGSASSRCSLDPNAWPRTQSGHSSMVRTWFASQLDSDPHTWCTRPTLRAETKRHPGQPRGDARNKQWHFKAHRVRNGEQPRRWPVALAKNTCSRCKSSCRRLLPLLSP